MKTTMKKLLSIILIVSTLTINVGMKSVHGVVAKLKDKKTLRNLGIKIIMISFVFVLTKSFGVACQRFDWYEIFAIYVGIFPYALFAVMIAFQVAPAESLDRKDNEKTYEVISFAWTYPVAILFAAISVALNGILPAMIITIAICGIKFLINSTIRGYIVEENERYLHTGFSR